MQSNKALAFATLNQDRSFLRPNWITEKICSATVIGKTQ
jgi:hypothetical protein